MSAASTRPTAPTTDVDTPTPPASTAPDAIFAPGRLCLDDVRSRLAPGAEALGGWYGRQTTEGHSYVGVGHQAVRLMDAVSREVYRVCAALVGELRADEEERAVRFDGMIVEFQACRAGDLPAGRDEAAPRGGGAA